MPCPPLVAVLLAATLAAGCQTNVSRGEAIEASLYAYEKAFRWQSPREAYGFLREDLRPAYPPPWIDSIRIVGYEVIAPPQEIRRNTVVQRVEVRYVNQDTQIVRTLVDEQLWESSDDGDTWERANPMPAFQ